MRGFHGGWQRFHARDSTRSGTFLHRRASPPSFGPLPMQPGDASLDSPGEIDWRSPAPRHWRPRLDYGLISPGLPVWSLVSEARRRRQGSTSLRHPGGGPRCCCRVCEPERRRRGTRPPQGQPDPKHRHGRQEGSFPPKGGGFACQTTNSAFIGAHDDNGPAAPKSSGRFVYQRSAAEPRTTHERDCSQPQPSPSGSLDALAQYG